MIQGGVVGVEDVVLRLQTGSSRIKEAVSGALNTWAKATASYIIGVKLSGGNPLHRRSGRLSRSIHGEVRETTTTVDGVVGGGSGVPYARIHEFGGVIPAHTVVAKQARALMIPLPGGTIFRRSANIPAIHMPERSYIRSGFREKSAEGIEAIKEAAREALLG